MDPSTANLHQMPMVKCSFCALDIELSAVAEHACSIQSPDVSVTEAPSIPYPSHATVDQPQYEPRSRALPPSRGHRPVLPKIDSSVTSRSGLRPSEAASIAHDLGLPSPLSAGGSGHRSPHRSRSRSRSRKASHARPPSPDIPISQDCAFPPFPMKSKRSQHERDVHTHKPHSTSRSTTSTRTYQHSSTHSASSSVYSNGSGPGRRRISNTSSSQQSRQGTIDDNMSLPASPPDSPRHSALPGRSREQSLDQSHYLQPAGLSPSKPLSESGSSVSFTSPTPSWPLDPRESSPKMTRSLSPESGWMPTESTIPEEQSVDLERSGPAQSGQNKQETFDHMLSPDGRQPAADMFDNPPREALYKTKRPAPLLSPQPHVPDDPRMPLSARAPTQPQPTTGGLTRTLTNLFSRKRSQSSSVPKILPLPSFDSPRMRALAPEPPDRPKRADGLWNTDEATDGAAEQPADEPLQAGDDSMTTDYSNSVQHQNTGNAEAGQAPVFDFKFNVDETPESGGRHQSEDQHEYHAPEVPDIVRLPPDHSEQDVRRASIDSASSYGSVGFSDRSASSKSSPVTSGEITRNISAVLEADQPPVHTLGMMTPPRAHADELSVPDSPTDPLYHAGRLSPVPELETLRGRPLTTDSMRPSTDPLLSGRESPDPSRRTRPVTPAGTKGRCRGCSELIITGQKSVASADGRLTGRFHKDCFVCHNCKEPFTTADFYVYNDQPYCAHHYHVLNNTLCVGCGKGIEGQFLETFDVAGNSSKKFHAKCLQCATCRVQLDDDYFEFNGRVYCERDAFRAASGPKSPYDTVPSRPSPLVREYINSEEPGFKGRFPERRTTRLIMT